MKTRSVEPLNLFKFQLSCGQGPKFIPDSELKTLSLKYSTEAQKLKDPPGYTSALIRAMNIAGQAKELNWFLSLKDPKVRNVRLRSAYKDETGEIYGAVTKVTALDDKRWDVEIVVSNHSSESIPYSIALIEHELVHARSYKDRIYTVDDVELAKFRFADEAKAFDRQIEVYLDLVKRDPALFCNWMYVTWSYGDLLVPLSWVMNSIEHELADGTFMIRYAQQGMFAEYNFLLIKDKSDLTNEIKNRIRSLKLEHVGFKSDRKGKRSE